MSRKKRDPLAGAVIILLFAMTGFLLARFSLVRTDPTYPPLPRNFDVIVIGSGLSGNLAAISTAQNNADVLYINLSAEASAPPAYAPVFWAAGTEEQQDVEITYLPETMALDIYQRGLEEGSYAQILTASLTSAAAKAWLEELTNQSFEQLDAVNPGLHYAAQNVPDLLLQRASRKVSELVLQESKALKPIRILQEDNTVQGVLVLNEQGQEEKILCRAVVLADGGYASNPELLFEWAGVSGVIGRNEAGHQGVGLRLAEAAKAELQNLDNVLLVPIVLATGERVENVSAENALLFNQTGEIVPGGEPLQAILQQNNGRLFLVLGAGYTGPAAMQAAAIEDIDQLADVLKVNPTELGDKLKGLTPPWRVAVLGLVAFTPGGLVVTEEYQVMGPGRPITGLYAAGEGTGGLHGSAAIYELFLTETVISARLAGENAADYATR